MQTARISGGISLAVRIGAIADIDGHQVTNSADGVHPNSGVVLSDGVLYGTTWEWGPAAGTIFRVNTDGTGFRTLYTNLLGDGWGPRALLLVGNTLYGTTSGGGVQGCGTIFKIDTDGNNFTNFYSFTTNNEGGVYPHAGLVLDGTNLMGTTSGGGEGNGTVFKIGTNGGGYLDVYVFRNGPTGGGGPGDILLSQGVLYGTAGYGNAFVFKLNTDGSGFTNLHSFSTMEGSGGGGSLCISGDTLFGTTAATAATGGSVFKVNTDGSGFAVVHWISNLLGAGRLTLLGNTLYGATGHPEYPSQNRLFKVNVDGSGFAILYIFTDAAVPLGDFVSSGGVLYGTTMGGDRRFGSRNSVCARSCYSAQAGSFQP